MMIKYLVPTKNNGAIVQPMNGAFQRKCRKFNILLHKIWHVYLGQPRKVIRIIVFFACSIAVLFQLSQCFRKLTNPPISTRSRVMLNSSMSYPSITICRSPSYKADVLKKHGLGASMRWTSEWKHFPFDNATLSEFWEEATYTAEEVMGVYGLNRKSTNVEIRSTMYYLAGQCHTIMPLVETPTAGLGVGYSLLLMHNNPEDDEAGWEVFVHEPSEPWTETGMQRSGSSEGVWMEAEEELHLKITAQHIKTISHKNNFCESSLSYSINECISLCLWEKLAGTVGCTAPWMHSIKNRTNGKTYKECDNYQDTRQLVMEYMRQGGLSSGITTTGSLYEENRDNGDSYGCQAKCLRPCHVTQYTSFVVNRKSLSGGRDKRSAPVEDAESKTTLTNRNGINGDVFIKNGSEKIFGVNEITLEGQNCTGSNGMNGSYNCSSDSVDSVHLRLGYDFYTARKEMQTRNYFDTAKETAIFSKLNVFYTSKMVAVMEENWGYDFSQFVADAGGSLGFLLGMSVVGAVALLEQLAEAIVSSASDVDSPEEIDEMKKKSNTVISGHDEETVVMPYEPMKSKY